MESKIEELTQTLYRDGIKKAQSEAEEIISKAHEEASRLLTQAKADASQILEHARSEATTIQAKTKQELQIAGEQGLMQFRKGLEDELCRAILTAPTLELASDKNFLAQVIGTMVKAWPTLAPGQDPLVTLPKDSQEALAAWVDSSLVKTLGGGLTVTFEGRFHQGFRIGPGDGSWTISFTDKDMAALLASFVKSRTREVLFPGL